MAQDDNSLERATGKQLAGQDKEFSGQLRLRLPKTLHKQLAQAAAIEGISLNMLIVYLLSGNYARRNARQNDISLHYAHKVQITMTALRNTQYLSQGRQTVDFFGSPRLWEV